MQLECNGQVCESYRERERAGEQLRCPERRFGGICKGIWNCGARVRLRSGRMCIMVVVVRVRVLQRVQTGVPQQQTSSYMYAHREAPRSRRGRERERRGVGDAEHVPRWRGLERRDPGREVDDARSRDIFHLHTTKPNTLSSGSADPRHQRLRRAASL